MESKKNPDHWYDLASEIGAEVPEPPPEEEKVESQDATEPTEEVAAEAENTDEPTSVTEEVSITIEAVEETTEAIVISESEPVTEESTDWGELHGVLGLEVPPELVEEPAPPEEIKAEDVRADEILEIEVSSSTESQADLEFPVWDAAPENGESDVVTAEAAMSPDVADLEPSAPQADAVDSPPQDDSDPLASWERYRATQSSDDSGDPLEMASDQDEFAELAGEMASESMFADDPVDTATEESSDAGGDEEEGEEDRPRRRRRRRGRRRRGAATEAEDASDTTEDSAEEAEADVEEEQVAAEEDEGDSEEGDRRGKRGRRRRRKRRRQEESPAAEAEAEAEDEEDADDEDESSPKKHRKIPTWDEAISAVVDSNLESRSKSRPEGRRRRRRS